MPDSTHGEISKRSLQLSQMAGGFKTSAAILSSVHLGVFSALSTGAKTAVQLAGELNLDERGAQALLDALTGLDLLKLEDGHYELHGLADEFLRDGSPWYMGDIFEHNFDLMQRWVKLHEAVRTGKSVKSGRERTPEQLEAFILGMHNISRISALSVVDFLDLRHVRRILDVGSGPGTYLYEMLKHAPEASGAILDFPKVIDIARRRLSEEGLEDRVDLIAGDMFETDFGGPWDLIYFGNIIHSHNEDRNRELMKKSAAALEAGGQVLIKDFFLDESRTAPSDASLFTLNMLLGTGGGRSFSRAETEEWLRDAGLTPIRYGTVGASSGMILAEK